MTEPRRVAIVGGGILGMTAACAPGITVVGIDNGYGAACAVARLARRSHP